MSIFLSDATGSACGKVRVTTRKGFKPSLPAVGTMPDGAVIMVVRIFF